MNRHRLDLFALSAGLVFLALAVGFLLDATDTWDAEVMWLPPVLLIASGLSGVLSTLTRRSGGRPES
ncbi:MAG: hypothetical protein ACT4OX_13295 [Actinomycetota bacterium]